MGSRTHRQLFGRGLATAALLALIVPWAVAGAVPAQPVSVPASGTLVIKAAGQSYSDTPLPSDPFPLNGPPFSSTVTLQVASAHRDGDDVGLTFTDPASGSNAALSSSTTGSGVTWDLTAALHGADKSGLAVGCSTWISDPINKMTLTVSRNDAQGLQGTFECPKIASIAGQPTTGSASGTFDVSFATAPTGESVDVAIDHIEVVQVVQDPKNSLPLIADKATVARVFVRVNGPKPVENVTLQVSLYGLRNGSPAAPAVLPQAIVGTVRPAPDRQSTTESATFRLPGSWVAAGSLGLEAKVDVGGNLTDSDPSNNDDVATVEFVPGRTFDIVWVPVCMGEASQGSTCPVPSLDSAVPAWAQEMASRYPVADGAIQLYRLAVPIGPDLEAQTWAFPPGLTSPDSINPLLRFLSANLAIAKSYSARRDLYPDQLIGIVPSSTDAATKAGGAAGTYFGGHVAYLSDNQSGVGLAHEIGHNLGLHHLRNDDPVCGVAAGPYDPGPTAIGELAFDVAQMKLVPPTTKDLMSYCQANESQNWLSPAHYATLFGSQLQPKAYAVAAVALTAASGSGAKDLLVTGTIQRDGSAGTLDPAIAAPAPAALDGTSPATGGPVCLSASGGTAAPVQRCFTVSFVTTNETGDPVSTGAFVEAIPDPPGTTTVNLTFGGRTLATLGGPVAPTPPRIDLGSHAGERWSDRQALSWSVTGGSGAIRTLVLYSPDGGGTWLPFSPDPAGTSVTIDPRSLVAGSANMFRVIASDGVQTATADAGPITVPDGIGRPGLPTRDALPAPTPGIPSSAPPAAPTGLARDNPGGPGGPGGQSGFQPRRDDTPLIVVAALIGVLVLVLLVAIVRTRSRRRSLVGPWTSVPPGTWPSGQVMPTGGRSVGDPGRLAPPANPSHTVPATGLPAWAAPDASQPPITMLAPGLPILVVEMQPNGWARVEASNGWAGWVDGRQLLPIPR